MNRSKNQGRPAIHDPAFKIAVARDYLTSVLGVGKILFCLPGVSHSGPRDLPTSL
jgi:hypothetical protein